MTIAIYFTVALINVFLHVFKNILTIKSTKLRASFANCICYTFAAVVIKFIAEVDLWIAIAVQATTNFAGNWLAMWLYEVKFEKKRRINMSEIYDGEIKVVKPKSKLEEIVVCDCGSLEHQIYIHATDYEDGDEDNGFVYLSVHLAPQEWYRRLWYAIKYIFGYKCCYGAFEEVILKPKDVPKFEKVVKWLKEHDK